jgi:hypothetical protein
MTTGYAVESSVPKPLPIGGLLLLPAIGIVLSPIVGVVALFIGLGAFTEVQAAGFGAIYALELVTTGALLAFSVYTAIRFFGRRSDAPTLMIILMLSGLVTGAALLLIEWGVGASEFAVETIKGLFRDGFSAAIWIPYFKQSKRVKATFVDSGADLTRNHPMV